MTTALNKTHQMDFANLAIKAKDLDLSGDLDVTDDVAIGGDLAITGAVTSSGGFKQPVVNVTDAASYTVLAANSGKVHVIPDLTADCTLTLPTPASGLYYIFIYGGAAADAQDWIISTGSGTNYYVGGGVHFDSDAGAGADEAVPVFSDGNSNDFLTVLTPQGGTKIELWCDGTLWYVNAVVVSATASALAFSDT
jgi:hypothetical protein